MFTIFAIRLGLRIALFAKFRARFLFPDNLFKTRTSGGNPKILSASWSLLPTLPTSSIMHAHGLALRNNNKKFQIANSWGFERIYRLFLC